MTNLTQLARQGRANALANISGSDDAPRLRARGGCVISFSSVRSRS